MLQGEVWDVAVDVRPSSPHFKEWAGATLSSDNRYQLYIPEGFAHGFCVLSETALFAYKCSDHYDADAEITIRWDDPEIAIDWPVEQPELSARDAAAPLLDELGTERLPA